MAKEQTIRKHAKNEFENQGYIYWIPAKTQWHENDIFGVFDAVLWQDDEIIFIQYTSKGHISDRRRKINDFFAENDIELPDRCRIEIWGYIHNSGGDFKVEEYEQ